MKHRLYLTGLLFCLTAIQVRANSEVVLNVSAPERVAVGERFRLVFSLNERPASFEAPPFDGFRVLSGPSQSTSSSTHIINNQVTTTLTVSYTYILEATQEGDFQINPARATVDGRQITSEPVPILVSGQVQPGGQASPTPGTRQPPSDSPGPPGQDELFVRAVASNSNPYQGEQVIVTYKIYTSVPISRYSVDRLPSFQGFWSENLSDSSTPGVSTEVIDGRTYQVAEIRRVALFPQRQGELTVDPLEVECLVRVRSPQRRGSLFDDFFAGTPFDSFQQMPVTVRSNSIRLNVRPLPARNRPGVFGGLTGRFEINGSLHPSALNINDAATLTLTISGTGNLVMMDKPAIPFSPDLEVFDPHITDNIRRERSGLSGTRTFEYLIIPRAAGEIEIPAIQMAWFDPGSGEYITHETGPFHLSVSSGPGTQAGTAAGGQESIRQVGTDIRFIHTNRFPLVPAGSVFFMSRSFYLWTGIPLLIFALLMVYWRSWSRLQGNEALLRTKKAEKLARKRLRKASMHLKRNENADFHEEVSRAMWDYLSHRLGIGVPELNREKVLEALSRREVDDALAGNAMEAIGRCDFARFAPGKAADEMDETFQLALSTIVRLEKAFRKKGNLQTGREKP